MTDDVRRLQLSFDEHFQPFLAQRGHALAGEGGAHVERIRNAPGKLRIQGHCLGSRGKKFQQDIQLSHNSKRITHVTGACSCPDGLNCEHVAAVLACWQNERSSAAATVLAAGGAQMASGETLGWLQGLEQLGQPAASVGAVEEGVRPAAVVEIRYVLNAADSCLTLYKTRLLKDGSQGRPELLRPDLHQLTWGNVPAWFKPEDMPILRLFLALQDSIVFAQDASQPLRDEEGAQLLRLALRTGRLHLDSLDRPVLHQGPGCRAVLVWQTQEDGRQKLRAQLPEDQGQVHVLLPTWPVWYVNAAGQTIGPVEFDLPEDLVRRLLAAPPLDEIDALLVRLRLAELGARYQLELPLPEATPPEQATGKPLAILRLQAVRLRLPPLGAEARQGAATLWFEYPGLARTPAVEPPPPLLRGERQRDGAVVTVMRDQDAESVVWSLLHAHGLESYQRRLPRTERLTHDAATDYLMPAMPDAAGWLLFLELSRPALAQAGVLLEISDDFPFQAAEAEDWFVEVLEDDLADNSEWFNLDLGVIIEGKRVSLVEPLARLIAQRPLLMEELRRLDDEERVPLPLDDRRILPVPARRLRLWLGPLLEFAGEGGAPRLSRLNAGSLCELETLPGRWFGGEKLRLLGQRLRNFTGIEQSLPAAGFKATLRGYQQAGLDWLQFLRAYDLSGILADDMGLGKTIQTLAHLHLEKASGRANLPSMIVMPTSLITNWCSEAERFAPDLAVLTLHGPGRSAHFSDIARADVIFTTYPLLVRDQEVLLQQEFHLLVLDEAQFIKNPKAHAHRVARQLKARHRLSLTGTPLENHLGELWAQYNFLMPGLLGDVRRFAAAFRTPIEKQNDAERRQQLAERVRPFLLRRTKEQVLAELPPKTEVVRWVELTGEQRDMYESLRLIFDRKLRQVLATRGVGQSQIMILDALLKLRQVCCDPRLVKLSTASTVASPAFNLPTGEIGDPSTSAKLGLLMGMLPELIDEGRRILLFSQFTSMLALIEEALRQRGIDYVKLTGQTKDRDTPINRFQQGEVSLFMISLKAGGTGLNLTAADTVIHFDPWWNPAVEEQASARAYRIGQDKPVFVYKLLTKGTVEEKILALQDRKRNLADQLLSGAAPQQHLITAEDIDLLFQPLEPA